MASSDSYLTVFLKEVEEGGDVDLLGDFAGRLGT